LFSYIPRTAELYTMAVVREILLVEFPLDPPPTDLFEQIITRTWEEAKTLRPDYSLHTRVIGFYLQEDTSRVVIYDGPNIESELTKLRSQSAYATGILVQQRSVRTGRIFNYLQLVDRAGGEIGHVGSLDPGEQNPYIAHWENNPQLAEEYLKELPRSSPLLPSLETLRSCLVT
jgi:hypothetical protein